MKNARGKIALICMAASVVGGCGREGGARLEDMQLSIAPVGEGEEPGENSHERGGTSGGDSLESTEQGGSGQEADSDRAAMIQAYITVLEDIFFDQKFPGDQDYGYQPVQGEDVAANQFAVYDIDGDGKEELIITYFTTYTAGQGEMIYGFDSASGTVREELRAYPSLIYYDNGIVEEQM